MKYKTLLVAALVVAGFSLTSCEKDELTASVSINETGSDLGGDVTGEGGTTTKSYTWNNDLSTADWNMDITATSAGSFNLMIKDSEGKSVLNETLTSGVGDDSKSGVTSSGASGQWSITIILTDFIGDGSFSLSPGN